MVQKSIFVNKRAFEKGEGGKKALPTACVAARNNRNLEESLQ
jgi:hypothetical protein